MNIKVKTFAALRDIFGRELSLEVENDCCINQITEKLIELKPESSDLISSSRLAINEEFLSGKDIVGDGDELLILPPSSGG